MFKKPNKLSWFVLGVTFFIFVLMGMDEFIDLGGDSAQYVILAKSLVSGHGLRALNYPGQPLWTRAPLLSLLLAPFVYFFGINLYPMHFFMLFLSFFFFFLMRKYLDYEKDVDLLWITGMVAFNFTFLFQVMFKVLTEIPFAVFTILSLLYFERAQKESSRCGYNFLLSVAFLIFAYFTRHIAVALYLAFIFSLMRQGIRNNAKKILTLTFIFVAFACAWHLRNNFLAPQSSVRGYAAGFLLIDNYYPDKGMINFSLLLARMAQNFIFKIPAAFGLFIFPFFSSAIFLSLLGWTVFAGWAVKARKNYRVGDTFFLIYLIFVAAWSSDDFARYLLPLSFLIVYYFYHFIVFLVPVAKDRKGLLSAMMVLIFSANIVFTLAEVPARYFNPYRHELRSAVSWLKNNVHDPSAKVVALKPTIVYLYSGLQSMRLSFSLDADAFRRKLDENNVTYLIVDSNYLGLQKSLPVFLSKYSGVLSLVHAQGGTAVFKVQPLVLD